MPFVPRSERSKWKVIYDQLQYMNIGDKITYEELVELLPDTTFSTVRLAFHRAAKEMLVEHKRAFECVRGVGYVMVHPNHQEQLAQGRERRSRRQIQAARAHARNVDLNLVAPDVRRRLSAMDHHYRNLEGMMRTMSRRQNDMEQRQSAIEQRTAIGEKDSAMLADRIDRLTALLRAGGYLTDEEVGDA